MKLYPFQKIGVKRLWDFQGRALLCDEVGLGKSAQALTFFIQCSTARPGIIVCPAGLKINWQREAKKWYNIETLILEGRRPVIRWFTPPELIIINFEILKDWLPVLRKLKPQLIIIDEAQNLANINSQRCIESIKLCHKVPHVLLLTGTPIINRHWDLFPLLHILDPKRWDSPFSYGMEFCAATEERGKLVFKDSVQRKKLHKILTEDYMIRRTKEEVLPDLPKLRKHMLPLEIEKRSEYDFAERDFLGWLSSYDLAKADRAARAARFVKMGYLKRLAVACKMKFVFEWIDNFLEGSDGKLILGAWHRNTWPHTINLLEKRYENSVSIHGGKTQQQKADMVDQFQNDKDTRIIILQIKSGGVGINLQGAKRSMALIEQPWHPADVLQFIGRGHRIGTVDPVDVWFLLAYNTIEEKICEIIQKKSKINDNTIEGKSVTANSLNLLDELTLALKAKRKP